MIEVDKRRKVSCTAGAAAQETLGAQPATLGALGL